MYVYILVMINIGVVFSHRAYGSRGESRLRREGNIHRLTNPDDDDDENNTWNGNSTQQM